MQPGVLVGPEPKPFPPLPPPGLGLPHPPTPAFVPPVSWKGSLTWNQVRAGTWLALPVYHIRAESPSRPFWEWGENGLPSSQQRPQAGWGASLPTCCGSPSTPVNLPRENGEPTLPCLALPSLAPPLPPLQGPVPPTPPDLPPPIQPSQSCTCPVPACSTFFFTYRQAFLRSVLNMCDLVSRHDCSSVKRLGSICTTFDALNY